MSEQQSEIDNSIDMSIEEWCRNEAAKRLGYDHYEDFLLMIMSVEERTDFWVEYNILMDEEREFERIVNMITVPISEGLWQSNNLKSLIR